MPFARLCGTAKRRFYFHMIKTKSHFDKRNSTAPAANRKSKPLLACAYLLLLVYLVTVSTSAQDSSAKPVQQASTKFPTAVDAPKATNPPAAEPPKPDQVTKQEIDPNSYIIGEQDALMITVWKEKDMSGGVVVRPDGKITVPLVGELSAVGLTPVQLQSVLAEKLKPFITVPKVTVAVSEIRSRKVYVIGHTGREGPFMINSSTTILQLIAQAGGVKDFAKRKKIYILRGHGTTQVRIPFNYDDVIKGKHPEQNVLLQPGDTIVVP